MSFIHGSKTEVLLDGADVSSFFRKADLSAEVDTADSTTFKKTWKTFVPGMASAKVDLEGLYDPSLTSVRTTLGLSADSILTIGPAGLSTLGNRANLIQARAISYAETAPIGDVVAFNYSVTGDAQGGFGAVIHPLAARTTSGTGTTFDGNAASTNGLVGHLHVTAISGASANLSVTMQHSTDGNTWSSITGGTFSSFTATGAERKTTSTLNINRYLRVTWTISGTTPSITFAVAVARL